MSIQNPNRGEDARREPRQDWEDHAIRAIKIAPVEKTVSEIELAIDNNKSFDELYRLIRRGLVQLDRDIVPVCDEETR